MFILQEFQKQNCPEEWLSRDIFKEILYQTRREMIRLMKRAYTVLFKDRLGKVDKLTAFIQPALQHGNKMILKDMINYLMKKEKLPGNFLFWALKTGSYENVEMLLDDQCTQMARDQDMALTEEGTI